MTGVQTYALPISFADVQGECLVLVTTTLVFLVIGALLFSWNE